MDRRVGLTVLAGGLLAVLLISVATAGGVRMWHEPTAAPSSGTFTAHSVPVETIPVATAVPETEDTGVPVGVAWLIWTLLAIAAALLAIAVVKYAWLNRPQLRWRRQQPVDLDFDTLPDIALAMATDAQAQRAALLHGAPRNAIVECWLRLEHAVAAAGLERDPADTSAELTERVLAAYSVDHDAIVRLASLYREAGFSRHELGEVHREAAMDALQRLHEGLDDLIRTRPVATS